MKYTKEDCVLLLRGAYTSLGRFPQRSDFAPDEVVAIKSFFGPWPRALEAAGIKEPRADNRLEHNREKRRRAARRRRENRMSGSQEQTIKNIIKEEEL
ncbi:MAG: homing endonuclease associated repeat-containing protein [Eubacteriales bacterium]